ncbi:NAD-dependent succinate-semialdehyde dehydrogenase [Brevibacterium permense]|uniref:NAD-dependent succinate-semialdehyde dehydrogenase n=1 Tax=Brevibacterium permense TaxID=234834 RepID=UPI0021CFB93A|nr:NAD-dependent succinate-semialdehyde dehydrogenase [Brevibacterium permense]MCU4298825.1 NAD-dependent succinate-semialdehyde dehydrogenase [Brevibacterium permense]
MSVFAVTSPATGKVIAEYPESSNSEIETALDRSHTLYRSWSRQTSVADRARHAEKLADLFLERKDELASIINLEMGKPLAQARGEVEFSSAITRKFGQKAEEWLADEILEVEDGLRSFFRFQGIGPLLGIMPWNFPYYQVVRFAVPNLILGNTVILRHASQCPNSALALEKLFSDAGFPNDSYINVFASHDQISTMIADDRIQGVSLTGSEKAGAIVAEQAGRHLKKCVLELGGADPFIVLDTDDIDFAVAEAVKGRMDNSGQSCTASKRVIVLEKYYDEFSSKFVQALRSLSYDRGDFGPLSSKSATDDLQVQVKTALEQGAELLTGDNDPDGNIYTPSALGGISPEMEVYSQELFGPVAQLYRASTDDEAIEIANSSPYGLGSVVICDDVERAEHVGTRLDVGMVFVGAAGLVGADVPFGGVKKSGYGREMGKVGMLEFANKKLFRFAEKS